MKIIMYKLCQVTWQLTPPFWFCLWQTQLRMSVTPVGRSIQVGGLFAPFHFFPSDHMRFQCHLEINMIVWRVTWRNCTGVWLCRNEAFHKSFYAINSDFNVYLHVQFSLMETMVNCNISRIWGFSISFLLIYNGLWWIHSRK